MATSMKNIWENFEDDLFPCGCKNCDGSGVDPESLEKAKKQVVNLEGFEEDEKETIQMLQAIRLKDDASFLKIYEYIMGNVKELYCPVCEADGINYENL